MQIRTLPLSRRAQRVAVATQEGAPGACRGGADRAAGMRQLPGRTKRPRLDLRLTILDSVPFGQEQVLEIERVWLLAIIAPDVVGVELADHAEPVDVCADNGVSMATAAAERLAHPLVRRNYRVATAAIEGLVDVVECCLRVHMPGALVYARPRMGKTHAVDYLCLHLARERPDVLTIRMSANIIGGFRRGVLQRAPHCCGSGARFSEGQIAEKRQGLIRRLREALAAASRGHVVALFCDEGAAPVEKQLRLAQRCP